MQEEQKENRALLPTGLFPGEEPGPIPELRPENRAFRQALPEGRKDTDGQRQGPHGNATKGAGEGEELFQAHGNSLCG